VLFTKCFVFAVLFGREAAKLEIKVLEKINERSRYGKRLVV
jgi:hypothetical protein